MLEAHWNLSFNTAPRCPPRSHEPAFADSHFFSELLFPACDTIQSAMQQHIYLRRLSLRQRFRQHRGEGLHSCFHMVSLLLRLKLRIQRQGHELVGALRSSSNMSPFPGVLRFLDTFFSKHLNQTLRKRLLDLIFPLPLPHFFTPSSLFYPFFFIPPFLFLKQLTITFFCFLFLPFLLNPTNILL